MSSNLEEFASEETWRGGHYGIEIELGSPSDDRLMAALEAFWSLPSVNGCYTNHDRPVKSQVKVVPGQYVNHIRLYGTAILPSGAGVACGTFTCRLQNEAGVVTRDLLSFYLPLGSISRIYPVGSYPFGDLVRAMEWRTPLDQWFVQLGTALYERVRFPLALIGWEVDFPNVTAETVKRNGVPAERYDGYLVQTGNGLEWYPPTNFEIIRIKAQLFR
jgi:hypothetical protein